MARSGFKARRKPKFKKRPGRRRLSFGGAKTTSRQEIQAPTDPDAAVGSAGSVLADVPRFPR